MTIETPAKINLTLELLGRRPDGFHEVATWMVPVGLSDRLEIEFAAADYFSTETPGLSWDDGNLIFRAVQLFRQETGTQSSYRIELTKRIPIGAGLAGGSSDAAATLRLLSRLHGRTLTDDELAALAARLGSDTAFFIRCKPAWCTGRGEVTTARPLPDGLWSLLAKPGFGIPTAAAYAAYARLPPAEQRGQIVGTPWGRLRNDLEPAVFPKYVILPVLKSWLARQPETRLCLMSGSGSTVFAVTDEGESRARELQERFLEFFGPTFWSAVCQLNPVMAGTT
ncbi:MAG: 4-(cytidine 5'-diphospho)-2-C-methyl-D-erythritol kinase [Verrucomicrobia bacterium]|nr:4-(cytidine 5'-diphospho)-2-C-methyl-D-erythritol kinase [Verrucomicrobiota bacterium]